MNTCKMIMEREDQYLSQYASKSSQSLGRDHEESPCDLRTPYQRDRDRIIHSKAFRRLKHKTQVFISPSGDHYRTRLTHTLEVVQISRTIARALSLNEDLAEAIGLGHDLGHTPFGHLGEAVLSKLNPSGFKHYQQSVRIVEFLESRGKVQGLNLSYEVIDGIRNHTGDNMPSTLEAMVVKYSDRIAYINHDIDDSIRAGILSGADLPRESIELLGRSHGQRIDTMVRDLIKNSLGKDKISMSSPVFKEMNKLRDFLFEVVYTNPDVKKGEENYARILKELYYYYLENPQAIPQSLRDIYPEGEDIHRIVTDYIAGMTDQYIMYSYDKIFMPKAWNSKD